VSSGVGVGSGCELARRPALSLVTVSSLLSLAFLPPLSASLSTRSIDEAKRDAHRIDIMKSALQAKKRYLISAGGVDDGGGAGPADDAENDAWGDSAPVAAAPAFKPITSSSATTTAAAAAPPPPPPPPPAAASASAAAAAEHRDDDAWSEDSGDGGDGAHSSRAPSMGEAGDTTTDDQGALPAGWTLQRDEEGDAFYYNATTGETSWHRPNPDGTVPAQ
jgi:hypothetical protein